MASIWGMITGKEKSEYKVKAERKKPAPKKKAAPKPKKKPEGGMSGSSIEAIMKRLANEKAAKTEAMRSRSNKGK